MKTSILRLIAILLTALTGCAEAQTGAKEITEAKFSYTAVSMETFPEIETAPPIETIAAGSSHGVYEIRYKFSLLSNRSVGSDWKKSVTFHGRDLKNGGTVAGKEHDCITLHCTVWEEDSVPDIGNATVNIRLTDGAAGTVRITVCENRGRFKGNTDVWEFSYSVTLP